MTAAVRLCAGAIASAAEAGAAREDFMAVFTLRTNSNQFCNSV
jgi:hypothetical protein